MSAIIRLILIYLMRIHVSYLDEYGDKPKDNIIVIVMSVLVLGLEISIGYSVFKVLGI